ncbi:MAG TPA: hypothetical protein PKI36_12200 [Turneriella sp.]|nr:hypothetical protein [Turneriella sp.]
MKRAMRMQAMLTLPAPTLRLWTRGYRVLPREQIADGCTLLW